MTKRQQAQEEMNQLIDMGCDPEAILNHIISNYLSGSDALEALQSYRKEAELDLEDDTIDGYLSDEWEIDAF